jgi:hypothetical protein
MNPAEFEQKQYEISVQAGTNQRYHQRRANYWLWWDRAVRIAVGIMAVGAFSLSIVTAFTHPVLVDIASIAVAFTAASAAVALNVLPLGEWAAQHLDLFRRWTDLREDVDTILFDYGEEVTPEFVGRLKQLEGKAHRICGSEPECESNLYDQCFREELRSRQPRESQAICAS